MIKVLISDFWHVVLFPSDFHTRGSSTVVSELIGMEYAVNEELLAFYSKLKKAHSLQLVIYSSGTLFKTPEIQPILSPIFDKGFSVSDIRFEKDDPESFRYLAEQLKVNVSEVLFVDDGERNIEAAKLAGVTPIHYRSNEQAMREINQHFVDRRH